MATTLQIVGSLLALLGFAFGLVQFYNGQKWRRSEFAAKQLERIQGDPVLSTATRVLDWSGRRLPLPATLRLEANETYFDHSWSVLAEGIKPEGARGSFTREMEIYRDLFDALFGYFDEINHYVDIKLVTAKQVASLRYWLEQIAAPRFGNGVTFGPYLHCYGYSGTLALMEKLGVKPPA